MKGYLDAGQLRVIAETLLDIARDHPDNLIDALERTAENAEEVVAAANHECDACPAKSCKKRTEPFRGKLSDERSAAVPSGRKLND
jgi:hypothetical protein